VIRPLKGHEGQNIDIGKCPGGAGCVTASGLDDVIAAHGDEH
jgi:hypothetical protein